MAKQTNREKELTARERELERRERELDEREAGLRRDPFSQAVHEKKTRLYDKVPLNEKQLTWIIRIVYVLLGITAVLIILEAAGIYKIG